MNSAPKPPLSPRPTRPSASRNDTKANTLKIRSAQAPTDIGDQYLKFTPKVRASTSMCQKRIGRPRSSVRRIGQITSAGKLTRKARRASGASRRSPISRRMAPIAYAPPARPPRKKYQTMYHSHCGGAAKCWTMALLAPAPVAEREHRADHAEDGGDEHGEISPGIVAARQHRVLRLRHAVHLGLVGQEEQRVEPPVLLVAVEASFRESLAPHLVQPERGDVAHLIEVPELDRLGRANLGAGRRQVRLEPVVAERALAREPGRLVETDDVIGAGRDAVPTAVAHLGLDVDRVELGADDGVGRAHLHAARERAVLAEVAHHVPRDPALGRGPLAELHVAPVLVVELSGVVIAVAEARRVAAELVPLLARHLAGLAPDAERRVREEADRSRHGHSPIRSPSGWARSS